MFRQGCTVCFTQSLHNVLLLVGLTPTCTIIPADASTCFKAPTSLCVWFCAKLSSVSKSKDNMFSRNSSIASWVLACDGGCLHGRCPGPCARLGAGARLVRRCSRAPLSLPLRQRNSSYRPLGTAAVLLLRWSRPLVRRPPALTSPPCKLPRALPARVPPGESPGCLHSNLYP